MKTHPLWLFLLLVAEQLVPSKIVSAEEVDRYTALRKRFLSIDGSDEDDRSDESKKGSRLQRSQEQSTRSPTMAPTLFHKCSCSPEHYGFTMNLSLNCGTNILDRTSGGIDDEACFINGEGPNITDLVPVSVGHIQVIELNDLLQPIIQTSFMDIQSSTFSYSSVSNDNKVPHGLQMIAQAINAANQPLIMSWLITFSNDCNVFPVLEEGNRIGWTVFVSRKHSFT
jgi:hypothetical protein